MVVPKNKKGLTDAAAKKESGSTESLAPKKTTRTRQSKPKSKKYVSVRVALHHPFQKVLIPVDPPGVQLDEDNWLDSQIKAGFVKCL